MHYDHVAIIGTHNGKLAVAEVGTSTITKIEYPDTYEQALAIANHMKVVYRCQRVIDRFDWKGLVSA
jgi:hypothetical protein